MAKSLKEIIFQVGDDVAQELGMFLVDASLDREAGEKILRLYIDREGGVSIDDCEKFSRRFEEVFDEVDPIDGAYCLEVNSPGVDRILKTEREFSHYIGREVDVKLYGVIDGKKEFSGVLKSYEDNTAEIEIGEKVISVPVSKAVYIKLMFRF